MASFCPNMEVDSPADDQLATTSETVATSQPSRHKQQRAISGMAFLLQQMRSVSNETTTTSTTTKVVVETTETPVPEKPTRELPPRPTVAYSALSSKQHGDLEFTPFQVVTDCFNKNSTPAFGFDPTCPENNYVRSCRFAPTGDYLVCESEDRVVRVFDLVDEKLQFRKSFRQGGLVYNVTWDPFGRWIATTSGGSPIQFWSVDGVQESSYHGINHLDELEAAYCMAFNMNGERMYAGYRGVVRRFEIERPGRQISELRTWIKKQPGQKSILSCICMSSAMDGVFAVGCYGSGVGLYSDFTQSCDLLIPSQTRCVSCIQYSSDGQKIFIGGRKTNLIECFDIRNTAKVYATYSRETNTNQRYGFQLDSSGRFLFAGDSKGRLLAFDLSTSSAESTVEATWRIPNVTPSVVSDLSLHPSLPLVATAHGQRVFPRPLRNESDEENNEQVEQVDYVRLGQKLDNSVKLWKI